MKQQGERIIPRRTAAPFDSSRIIKVRWNGWADKVVDALETKEYINAQQAEELRKQCRNQRINTLEEILPILQKFINKSTAEERTKEAKEIIFSLL